MSRRARCGRPQPRPTYPRPTYPIVEFARSIGLTSTAELKLRHMLQFFGKGGKMAKPGDPPNDAQCARCGVRGVLFTRIGNQWYCTARCALLAKGRAVDSIKPPKEEIMARKHREEEELEEVKGEEEEVKPKSKRGEHLIPREPVQFPKELLKHPVLGPYLKTLSQTERSSREAARARLKLRDQGFKLSDPSTWKKFLKG